MSKVEEKKKKVVATTKGPVVDITTTAAQIYPMMRLAQDMHRAVITKDANSILKIFEEISITLENPFLYQYFRNLLDPPPTPLASSTIVEDMSSTTTIISTTVSDLSMAAQATSDDLKSMEEKNQLVLQELQAAVSVAMESAGDTEVMDAHIAVAQYRAKAYGKEDAVAAYETAIQSPKVSSGKKIDWYMSVARVTSFYADSAGTDRWLDLAHSLAEVGGGADWDRRNRLKIYRAVQMIVHRKLQEASVLFIDCIATFNATEYCTYTEFIMYTILTNVLYLPRPEIKKKILDGPEIITIQSEIPQVVRCRCRCFVRIAVAVRACWYDNKSIISLAATPLVVSS
jgi:26S proteasome subunit RPN7